MGQNFFDAISWLHKENLTSQPNDESAFGSFPFFKNETVDSQKGPKFDSFFKDYLNFENESTITPKSLHQFTSKELEDFILLIINDIIPQILTSYPSFTKSLKAQVENEFKFFIQNTQFKTQNSQNFSDLFFEEQSYSKASSPLFNNFLHFYASRMASFTIIRLKFIFAICNKSKINLQTNDATNPSSFLSQVFPKGSSKELFANSLTAHLFSWYRPSIQFYSTFESFLNKIDKISLPAFIITILSKSFFPETNLKFSPSISNPNFGNFLNLSLVNFPNWIKNKNSTSPTSSFPINHFIQLQKREDIVTTKIIGDQIPSVITALLNETDIISNAPFAPKSPTPIFYDFFLNEKEDLFCRYLFEIYFLTKTVLTHSSNESIDLISYIANLTRSKNSNTFKREGQTHLFPEFNEKKEEQYDRIVLNLLEYPKNNPHFYLFNQIMEQENSLKDDGFIVIFSSKKLFILSQREKIEQMLKVYKLEGSISFDKLKGKEDFPPFIYIFSKRNTPKKSWLYETTQEDKSQIKKNPCLSFRICGEISHVDECKEINETFINFFQIKNAESTPLYQHELENGVIFEFFQDAILDGRLINSSSKDSGQITHPSFFKHLIKSGLPLDHFFYLENLKNEGVQSSQQSFFDELQIPFSYQSHFPYILIVDLRSSDFPKIEIINNESYKGKIKEYGTALCHYFGIIPKINGININHFRLFFQTQIASQIVSLSLNGPTSKIKAKLSSILIPRFFSSHEAPPQAILKELEDLSARIEKSKMGHTLELERYFIQLLPSLNQKLPEFPWTYFSFLSHVYFYFHEQKEKSTVDLNHLDFRNPLLIKKLISLPQKNILPKNEDIFLHFSVKSHHELHLPLKKISLVSKKDIINQTTETFFLELKSDNEMPIVEMHSDYHLLTFVNFLLQNTSIGIPVSTILQNLKIPSGSSLNKVILDYVNDANTFGNIAKIIDELIEKILKQQILNLH